MTHLDTERLVKSKMRAVEGKRVFAVIGLMCVCLVIGLLLMLYAFDRDEEQSSIEYSETIEFKALEPPNIDQNHQKQSVSDESTQKSALVNSDRLKRIKRQLSFDPMHYVDPPTEHYLRHKRLSEKLQEIQVKFEQCRQFSPIPNDCEKFHREMSEIHQALDHEIRNSNLGQAYDGQNYAVDETNVENFGKFSPVPDLPGQFAMHELNREESANEYSPFPRFHEELDNRLQSTWNVNEPPQDVPQFSMPPPMPMPSFDIARDNEKISPLKAQNFGK